MSMCAVIQRGILGGFRNKIGNVVGTSWKGISVMKSLPLSVANPNTAGQQTARSAFGASSQFASKILSNIVKPLWDRFAQRESGFNAWIQTNIAQFPFDGEVNLPNLIFSKGKMVSTPILTMATNATTDVTTITWSTALADQYSLATDKAYIAVYNFDMDKWFFNTGTVARSVGTATISVPGTTTGDSTHAWLSFRRIDGTVVNISAYFADVA